MCVEPFFFFLSVLRGLKTVTWILGDVYRVQRGGPHCALYVVPQIRKTPIFFFLIDHKTNRYPAHYRLGEAGLDGHVRYIPDRPYSRTQTLTSTTSGFGRNMGDSPMVVVWPSRGADGNYDSVTLSQRKAPYETMPTPDPHPPFIARISHTDTWVRTRLPRTAHTNQPFNFSSGPQVTLDNPQITFTRSVSSSHQCPRTTVVY